MEKKKIQGKEEPKIQKLIEESLRNGYSDDQLKGYLKEKFYPRIKQTQRQIWDEQLEERRKNPSVFEQCNYVSRPFSRVTMFYNPHEVTIGDYILREAEYWDRKGKIQNALKKLKDDDERMLYMDVEFLACHILWMALAFGIAIGQMVEMTDQKSIEAIKNVIKEEALLPYLPRERKPDTTLTK